MYKSFPINICNLSLHCFNALEYAKCGSNNSTAEISVSFCSSRLFASNYCFFIGPVHMPNLSIHTASRVYSHWWEWKVESDRKLFLLFYLLICIDIRGHGFFS